MHCLLKSQPNLRQDRKKQFWYGIIYLPLLILGFFWHWIGVSIFICMILGMGIAFKNGRIWCNYMCPRGSFLDYFITKISPQKSVPKWFWSYKFRLSFIIILFTSLIFRVYQAYPNYDGMAFAFIQTLTITTVLALILALIFRARAWCIICPVGTFSGLIGGKNKPLFISSKCIDCKKCEMVCPMGLAPYKDKKTGKLQSLDCIKCKTCVYNCPVKALNF